MTRTQVGIVGAGPAGLMLARLLHLQGIESVVLENRSRDYVEHRIRAGVLEQPTVDLLQRAGVGERMGREGIVHHGIELQFDGERHRIPLSELTDGRSIVIYGQTEVVKDLIESRISDGLALHFEVEDVSVHDLESERPRIRYRHEGEPHELECDVIAGCDGFHGVCRASIPEGVLRTFEREYPFGWLGILAAVAPSSDELVYAHHERGFALLSLRSPSSAACTCSAGRTRTSPTGRTIASGASCSSGSGSAAGRSPRGACSRRASRACAASSPSPCATDVCT